jgi:hypothetical protein
MNRNAIDIGRTVAGLAMVYGLRAQAGIDVFNVLNRVNYTGYVGNLSSLFFGKPVSANPSLRVQLSLRWRF